MSNKPLMNVLLGLAVVVVVLAGAYALRGALFHRVRIAETINRTYSVAQAVDAIDAPAAGAATVTRLRAGADVLVVGEVEGDAYYQVKLPDESVAYVPVSAVPAAQETTAGAPAAPPTASEPASPVQEAAAKQPTPPTGDEAPLPGSIWFQQANDQLVAVRQAQVFLGPDMQAPAAIKVDAGTKVQVIAESTDGTWAWVATADGDAAYIAMADLGPA